jgi:hypothetical protein
MLSLDKRPSSRTLVFLTVIGAGLLVISSIVGGLAAASGGPPPAQPETSAGAREIRDYYRHLDNGVFLAAVRCFQSLGYALFVFGACVHLARRAAPHRLLTRVSYTFALLGPAAGICTLGASIMVMAVFAAGGAVPDGLLPAIPALARVEIVIWTAFLWMAGLGIYLWLKKRMT